MSGAIFSFSDTVWQGVFLWGISLYRLSKGVFLWGITMGCFKNFVVFQNTPGNTPSFRLAASHELTNFMYRKLRFSPNFIAKTRLRASTILAKFFQTNNNITWTS
jgi:hypothetical protein